MIRTKNEYLEAAQRVRKGRERLKEHQLTLEKSGLKPEQLKRALDPLRSFHLQLEEEVAKYECLKRGDIGEFTNLHGLGEALVALRIARGLTQRELASRLGVHESQVSRDERNEYHGITVERASRILDAFGVNLKSAFDKPVMKTDSTSSADDASATAG